MNVNTENTPNAILVIGAGELGMAVIRGLARHAALSADTPVTVLLRPSSITSRQPGKQRDIAELRTLGVRLLAGDLLVDSIADLADRFRAFDTVVCCTGFAAGGGTQLKLAHAVLEAGVRRYFPWQFGVDYDLIGKGSGQDLFDEQLDVRHLLRAQTRTEWVIVSTGIFTSYLFEPSFGIVDGANHTVHALGSWDNAVTVTTPEDIGVLTAAVLFAAPRIVNQVVYTAGDTVTYAQLADIVDSVLGGKVHRVAWDLAHLAAELARAPDDGVRKYRLAFAKGIGVAWDVNQTFNARHHIRVTGVEQWAREHLV
ncbi:aromatic alcohol reductase [Acerihabitans arboris]|uniref:Aromatic alcohol reductase n=1 Tax=Acerihabitans arboris TaxID=2691583 RepID=A0A845SIL7_9GAMM|nr:aromatic alcohol reductase [Acerihabitans arboris]NDL63779.1 aromatic alcohol reductase [Acerihabitans arboris]